MTVGGMSVTLADFVQSSPFPVATPVEIQLQIPDFFTLTYLEHMGIYFLSSVSVPHGPLRGPTATQNGQIGT